MRQYLFDHWLGDTKRLYRASVPQLRKHGSAGRPARLLLGKSSSPGFALRATHRSFGAGTSGVVITGSVMTTASLAANCASQA